MFNPSKYQQAVFDALVNTEDNLIIEAVAGSGKTKTIEEAIKLPQIRQKYPKILYLVFNKRNAEEAKAKLSCDVSTFNAFGWGICRSHFGYVKLDSWKIANIAKGKNQFAITKIVSLLKGYYNTGDDLFSLVQAIVDKHDIDVKEDVVESAIDVFNKSLKEVKIMDFDDQILMPIIHNCGFPRYDLIFTDECQDLNNAKTNLLIKIEGRKVCVGDSRQAIYGFAGADTNSMTRLKGLLNATELPLSICYRCSKAVVAYANKFDPRIESFEAAPEGSVQNITKKEYDPVDGDFVLSRVTAPLVQECMKRIKEKKKACILGRDIVTGLTNILKALEPCAKIQDAYNALAEYKRKETYRLEGKEGQLMALDDKCDTLTALFDSLDTEEPLNAVNKLIDSIFSESAKGIIHSTIHRAKGLESKNVFVFTEKMPHPRATLGWMADQEKNLQVVAYTRARENLFLVD